MWIHQSFQLNMHLDMFNMSPGTSGQNSMGQLSSSLNTGSCVVYGLNLIFLKIQVLWPIPANRGHERGEPGLPELKTGPP